VKSDASGTKKEELREKNLNEKQRTKSKEQRTRTARVKLTQGSGTAGGAHRTVLRSRPFPFFVPVLRS
jgi:hypothetical protein